MWLTLFAVGIAQFLVCVDYWSVAVALPDMARQFKVSPVSLEWVLSGYIIAFSATMAVGGRLGDLYGRKKLLLVGIAIFGALSVLVGLSSTFWMIVASRVVLGIGGGLIIPLATAVVSDTTPARDMTRILGFLTGICVLGGAVGPVVGGALTETWGWPWIFFLNLPISIIAFIMVIFVTRESRDQTASGRLDYSGTVLLIISIVSIALLIDRIAQWGILSIPILSLLAIAIVFIFLFILREHKAKSPLVELDLFRNRTFLGFVSSGAFSNLYWCLTIFTSTIMLQKVMDYTPLPAGLVFLAMSIPVSIASLFVAQVQNLIGAKRVMIIALVLQAAGGMILWWNHELVWLLIGFAIAGPGCAWGWSLPVTGSILSLPREKAGLASSACQTIVIMTGGLSITLAGTVIDGFADKTSVDPGVRISYLVGVLACIIGIILAWILIPRSSGIEQAEAADDTN